MSVINEWYLIMLLSTKISAYSGSFLFKWVRLDYMKAPSHTLLING